MEGVQTDFNHV